MLCVHNNPVSMISPGPTVLFRLPTLEESIHSSCVVSMRFLGAFYNTTFQRHRCTFVLCRKESTLHTHKNYIATDQTNAFSSLIFVVVEMSLLLHIDDSDCITDQSIANLFLMSLVQLPSLVKIEPRYTNDSTFSKTSPLRLICVFISLVPAVSTATGTNVWLLVSCL